jgi:hypothetical protein
MMSSLLKLLHPAVNTGQNATCHFPHRLLFNTEEGTLECYSSWKLFSVL